MASSIRGSARPAMARSAAVLVLALLSAATSAVHGSNRPLDVSGLYANSVVSTCDCWRWKYVPDHCGCASAGCEYVEQVELTAPDARGVINMSISAGANQSCYSKTEGPYQAHVDECGHVIGGSRGAGGDEVLFDPTALDQIMDTIVVGDVLGFGDEDAGFRHTMITRWNMSLCAANDRCFDGERFMCIEKFHTCSSGNCYNQGRHELVDRNGAFFERLSTTGITGKYNLIADESSAVCPSGISAFQFGTQLGLGSSRNEMRMTRLVDKSLSTPGADCIQFNSVCSGLQFHQYHQDIVYAGRVTKDGGALRLTLYLINAHAGDDDLLAVNKCEFRGEGRAPLLMDPPAGGQTGAVVGLSIMLALMIIAAAALGLLCLRYRRRFLDSRMDSAYNAFET